MNVRDLAEQVAELLRRTDNIAETHVAPPDPELGDGAPAVVGVTTQGGAEYTIIVTGPLVPEGD